MKEDFAGKYTQTNFITRGLVDNFYKNIESCLKNLELNSALELACGPGFSTERLSKMRPDITWLASDIDPDLVKEAGQRNPQIEITKQSIYNINYPADNFDLVVALEVLEHLVNPVQALDQLQRVTKKYCLLSVPREPLWRILNISRGRYLAHWGNTPGHLNHWSSRQFKQLVSNHFKILNEKKPWPWTILLLEK